MSVLGQDWGVSLGQKDMLGIFCQIEHFLLMDEETELQKH